jgi:hypothetical protein
LYIFLWTGHRISKRKMDICWCKETEDAFRDYILVGPREQRSKPYLVYVDVNQINQWSLWNMHCSAWTVGGRSSPNIEPYVFFHVSKLFRSTRWHHYHLIAEEPNIPPWNCQQGAPHKQSICSSLQENQEEHVAAVAKIKSTVSYINNNFSLSLNTVIDSVYFALTRFLCLWNIDIGKKRNRGMSSRTRRWRNSLNINNGPTVLHMC